MYTGLVKRNRYDYIIQNGGIEHVLSLFVVKHVQGLFFHTEPYR